MPKSNNFDIIRLCAALQVATMHSIQHLNVAGVRQLVESALQVFPGVPVFFFVSGFLISSSYDRNPSIRDFATNRCLRIYPALVVCFIVSVASVCLTGYFHSVRLQFLPFVAWAAAQLSFAQFYNPEFMRHYGVGVLNGSMWTISVELQFYALTPAIYHLCRSTCKTRLGTNTLILCLIAVFLAANRILLTQTPTNEDLTVQKLWTVSFVPWFYMFLAGLLVQRNFDWFRGLLGGRFAVLFPAYIAIAILASRYGGLRFGNAIGPLLFAALIAAVFSAAFSAERLSDRLLRRNDISYGVYIYHMPVVNLLLTLGIAESIWSLCTALSLTIVVALLSWFTTERPALALKHRPLYSHAAPHG